MTYLDARPLIQSGDVLLEQKGGVIRAFTGESFSHVALLLRQGDEVWVAEFTGRQDYGLLPASAWMADRAGTTVWWGISPECVRGKDKPLWDAALSFRHKKYSWWTLASVWLSQIVGVRTAANLVCSTFVQRCWEASGCAPMEKTPDPGDYLGLCDRLQALEVPK